MQETADLDAEFNSPMMEPRLIVEESIKQMLVCAENEAIIEIPTMQLVDGLIHLMAAYYVYNVQYPSVCKATLFFLQDILMERPDKAVRKPTRYFNNSSF